MPPKTTDKVVQPTDAQALAVKAPASQLEFRKSNEAIGLRVVEGSLTLLNRKVFNVLVYHAQNIGELGKHAPVDTPQNKKYFWVPLSALARDAHYDSKDMQFLRDQIEKMQDIKLRLDDETQAIGERLIASVKFVNPKGLRSKSGQVWVGFAFPPEVYENVMQPHTYTRLSIYYQGLLRGGPSLALYEICRRYATNPSKVTYIDSYLHWYGVLTGNPVPDDTESLPPYKYFKRDVLKPAIAEVNAMTDIDVELVEHKRGRRVEALQFKVELSKEPQLEFGAPALIDVSLLERLMKLGLNQHEASDILAQNKEEKVNKALCVVEARAQAKTGAPIESKPAYFRWALKNDVEAPAAKPASKPAKDTKPDGPSLLERFHTERAKAALDVFREMDDEQRLTVYDQFKAQATIKVAALDKVLDSALTRSALGMWYAQTLWGEPGVEELSYFADQKKILFAGEAA